MVSIIIHRFKRVNPMVAAALLMIVIVSLIIWQANQPKLYRLQVVNNSDLMIDQVRVLGSALVSSNTLLDLLPGSHGLLEIQLNSGGQLRFEVAQQGTKVDMIVVKNGNPKDWVQSLSVENNRRFLLSSNFLVL